MTKIVCGYHVARSLGIWSAGSAAQRPLLAVNAPFLNHCRHVSRSSTSLQPLDSATSLDVTNIDPHDEVNPPLRSLPAPLELPVKQHDSSTLGHLYRTGRAYGSFYWKGLKAAWANHKECRPIEKKLIRVKNRFVPPQYKIGNSIHELALGMMEMRLIPDPGDEHADQESRQALDHLIARMTRARYQTLVREREDWSKLPRFAVLVAICGEYLPLLIPFFPSISPKTCQIPKQITGVRKSNEERRRNGIDVYNRAYAKPRQVEGRTVRLVDEAAAYEETWKEFKRRQEAVNFDVVDLYYLTNLKNVGPRLSQMFIGSMSSQHLFRASLVLSLHGKIWDRIGLVPPRALLERRLLARMKHLLVDDLLLRESKGGVSSLSDEELRIACEERAIPLIGRPTDTLRQDLNTWLQVVFSQGPLYRLDLAVLAPWHEVQEAVTQAKQQEKALDDTFVTTQRAASTL
ncbi:hypothetical protein KVT40_006572 [Elsinoe batatas]|uniref:Letm1 RBD domain-containing protein n=1 Tax=Elsinoe batatas TaxID=2601811 RepID=A0A8K0KXW6_9PEZI|nr:hypothetical protein KVT40_006572 [Elsinoe batatas]